MKLLCHGQKNKMKEKKVIGKLFWFDKTKNEMNIHTMIENMLWYEWKHDNISRLTYDIWRLDLQRTTTTTQKNFHFIM